MKTNRLAQYFDELDDDDALDAFLQFDGQRPRNPKGCISKKLEQEEQSFIAAQDVRSDEYAFTYTASRHEAGWLMESLGGFYEQSWISDVVRQIKGGKEASVYLCTPGAAVEAAWLAAKVYRPRQLRNLKNDALYRVGRPELDDSGRVVKKEAELHAIRKRTSFGERLRHQSWIAHEFQALQALDQVGADVPRPYVMGGNAILMAYVGDEEAAAPTLQSVHLSGSETDRLFKRTVHNLDLMLGCGYVHGDLSAYNVLYWEGEMCLIDFPQVVSAQGNPIAWELFARDVTRICEYFQAQGIACQPRSLAEDLWRRHGHRAAHHVDPRHLDGDNPADRRAWESQA